MQSPGKDILAIIAFPDFYIYYPDSWHRKISKRLGITNGNAVLAGHSCVLSIEASSGRIQYFDFGRYDVPDGYGRARSNNTDPLLSLDKKAVFYNNKLQNLEEILYDFYTKDTIHHAAGPMFVQCIHNVNHAHIDAFVLDWIQKGFVQYDIFGRNASNCSRFVAKLISTVVHPKRLTSYFKRFCPSHTPLDNIAALKESPLCMVVNDNGIRERRLTALDAIGYYFSKRTGYHNDTTPIPMSQCQWVGSQAVGSFYYVDNTLESNFVILRNYDQKGRFNWERVFTKSSKTISQDATLQLGGSPNEYKLVTSANCVKLKRIQDIKEERNVLHSLRSSRSKVNNT